MLRMALSFICAFARHASGSASNYHKQSPSGYSSVRIVSSDEKIYTVEFELSVCQTLTADRLPPFQESSGMVKAIGTSAGNLAGTSKLRALGRFARFYSDAQRPAGNAVVLDQAAQLPLSRNVAPNPANYQVRYGFESWDDPVFGVPTTIKAKLEIMMVKDPAKAKCPVFEQEFRKEYVFGASKFWYRADGHMSETGNMIGRDLTTLWIPSHNQMPQSYCTNKLVIKERGGDTSYRVGNWGDTGPVVSYMRSAGDSGGSNISLSLYVRFAPTYDDKVLEAEVRRQLGCTSAPTKKWGVYPPAFIKERTLAPDTVQFYYDEKY